MLGARLANRDSYRDNVVSLLTAVVGVIQGIAEIASLGFLHFDWTSRLVFSNKLCAFVTEGWSVLFSTIKTPTSETLPMYDLPKGDGPICPSCGHFANYFINGNITAFVDSRGPNFDDGEFDTDDDSLVTCAGCGRSAPFRDFNKLDEPGQKNDAKLDRERFTLSVSWSVDDVLADRPDLTEDQAMQVLGTVANEHDASIGINWDVLNAVADRLYGSWRPRDEGIDDRV